MRRALWVTVALALGGCAILAQKEQADRIATLQAQAKGAAEGCEAKFQRGNPKTVVARTVCVNQAINILRPLMPYPDLLDLQLASNVAIAEKVQNGQMTFAESDQAFAQKFSELNAEEQRRLLATRSVGAQESAAAAAWEAARPKTCMGGPAIVGCF